MGEEEIPGKLRESETLRKCLQSEKRKKRENRSTTTKGSIRILEALNNGRNKEGAAKDKSRTGKGIDIELRNPL